MSEFTLGVISSIVATILGKLSLDLYQWFKSGKIKKALFLSHTGVQIYFGGHSDKSNDLMVHNEVIYAIKKLQPILEKYKISYSYHIDKDASPTQPSNCIICIGGEYINSITKKYLDDFQGKAEYLEKLLYDGQSAIIKMTPNNSNSINPRCVFLIIGITGRDTKSAVSFFTQNFTWIIKEKMREANSILYLKTQDEESAIIESISIR